MSEGLENTFKTANETCLKIERTKQRPTHQDVLRFFHMGYEIYLSEFQEPASVLDNKESAVKVEYI